MSISGISTAGLSSYITLSANSGSSSNTWNALGRSLSTGDLKTAQSLFTGYEKMISGSSALSSGSQFATDLETLHTALTKGDLATAKSAYQTVSTDLKNNPVLTMANTQAATEQAIQWIDDLLSLGHSNSSSSTYAMDPATYVLSAAFGYKASSSFSDLTTSVLNTAYGASSSSTTSTTTESSSTVKTTA